MTTSMNERHCVAIGFVEKTSSNVERANALHSTGSVMANGIVLMLRTKKRLDKSDFRHVKMPVCRFE
jgi:hypothetical protein